MRSKLIMQQHPFELSQSELESIFNNKNTELDSDLPNYNSDPIAATTLALGEEGGTDPIVSTEALGEEGGICVTPPLPITEALGEEGNPDITTLALGEEGGKPLATTETFEEEGGWKVPLQPKEENELMVELGKIENNCECNCYQEIDAIVASEVS